MTRNRTTLGRKPEVLSARPWSKRQRKTLKMKDNNIDDLLRVTSNDMVTAYELKLAGNPSLREINEKHKTTLKKVKLSVGDAVIIFSLLIFAFLVLIVAEKHFVLSDWISVGLFTVPLLIMFCFANFFVIKRGEKREAEANRTGNILKGFRCAIEHLNPQKFPNVSYNLAFIKATLKNLAQCIEHDEEVFDRIRKGPGRDIAGVLDSGRRLQTSYDMFEEVFIHGSLFDHSLNRDDFFKKPVQVHKPTIFKVELKVSESGMACIQKLMAFTEIREITLLIRRSLSLFDYLLGWVDEGGEIIFRKDSEGLMKEGKFDLLAYKEKDI